METVLQVLRAFRVDISASDDEPKMYELIKGDTMISIVLPDWVARKVVYSLSRTFGVHVHYFYRPEMIPPGTQVQ